MIDECPECAGSGTVDGAACPLCESHDTDAVMAPPPVADVEALAGTITTARDPNDPSKGNITISATPRPVWEWPRGEA